MVETDDWRLQGQERHLQAITLRWQSCRVYGDTWEHDHCAFCWTKFVEAETIQAPDAVSEGYTTTDEYKRGAEYVWICQACFTDFVDQFEWRVADADR